VAAQASLGSLPPLSPLPLSPLAGERGVQTRSSSSGS
jgi:hypothetical protein